ncbi:hypothetical protein P4S83_08935 [Aneurinibacillus thermoaerophilus]|nr:hypothetical protein [Aneurinibacillus thermoaerophilus]MED0762941.1 hypothetical protein [Aneurinibacillus thermoaerophilus]
MAVRGVRLSGEEEGQESSFFDNLAAELASVGIGIARIRLG